MFPFRRLLLALTLLPFATSLQAAMPAAAQNALVKQYCAVCHTDATMNGGLSLQHYDAAKRDPTLAAMMLSKLNGGAMGAAGAGLPDKASQEAWLASTKEQATGADAWFVDRENGVVSVSTTRELPPRIYRVKVACNAVSGFGEMRLTWSPQPRTGITMTASVDGNTPVDYRLEGKESMGNGTTMTSGHASVVLSEGGKTGLPHRSLTIRELFPGETVAFSFSELDGKTRAELSNCFSGR